MRHPADRALALGFDVIKLVGHEATLARLAAPYEVRAIARIAAGTLPGNPKGNRYEKANPTAARQGSSGS